MKLVLDGLTVNVADDQSGAIIEKHIASLTKKLADAMAEGSAAEEAAETAKKEKKEKADQLDAATGEIAVLKKAVADAAVTPEKLDVMVKDRLAVIDAAKPVLGKDYTFDGKTVEAIRRDAVVSHLGDAAKDMSDEVVGGAFLAMTKDAKTVTADQQIAVDLRRPHHGVIDAKVDARDAALAERNADLQNAWKRKA